MDALRMPGRDPHELPVTVTVLEDDGAYTPGPCVVIEVGNAVEMERAELAWLVGEAGPRALAELERLEAAA